MNGGAFLSIDAQSVDIHYRELDKVEYWTREARAGRFRKEYLPFYAAGIPTYVVMAELALNRVLHGSLSAPTYLQPLSRAGKTRWRNAPWPA
jgi:hypothetical protein